MRPREHFIARPVESLQHMLRVLAQGDERLVPVIPDGTYSQNTMAAVTAFQRRYGLPVTGVTDQATWDKIVEAYHEERVHQEPAEPILIILNPAQVIHAGEHNHHVHLVQAILLVLNDVYPNIPKVEVNGTMDKSTVTAVQKFQEISGLPETGDVDKVTWQHLAKQYSLAAGNGTGIPNRFIIR